MWDILLYYQGDNSRVWGHMGRKNSGLMKADRKECQGPYHAVEVTEAWMGMRIVATCVLLDAL